MQNIYWADLHNHNEIGYAEGTLNRTYQLARNSLDVCAFSAHGFWPDPPASDPQMVSYHTEAFDRIKRQFPQAVSGANAQYTPGEFVTFIGYEWHSIGWGDFVILFPGREGELYRGEDYEDIAAFVRSRGALLIPHHTAYEHGRRGTNWSVIDPEISPIVEIFSEHASSFDRETIWPMILHSMGGSTTSQTVRYQIKQGRHFGFTAGTDNHFGYPGTYGEGITGIIAGNLTREAIFDALRRRHCYGATGDRIAMQITANGAIMGDVLPASDSRVLDIAIDPLNPLEFVEVLKNGERAQLWAGCTPPATPEDESYLLRLEWGWGRMDHPELTQWEIALSLQGGRLKRAIPCFAGGPGSVELVNLITEQNEDYLEIESFTSRLNPQPISGVVLEVAGDGDTLFDCQVDAESEDEKGSCQIRATLRDQLSDDTWAEPFTRFSSPRIRLGRGYATKSLAFHVQWEDPEPGLHDTYIVKAQQQNGQIAWASPILFTNQA